MGLASALSTALTGLSASETTIDVVGNNLANSNTVGFKSSLATFATQFLQTQSLGSAPTAVSGGTDPRQTGLGVTVAGINPNFNQGTVQVSTTPTDLAIQGDGFFIVQASTGDAEYTRNGQFKLNSSNQLVSNTGNRVLGYGVDSNYNISSTSLTPITVPIGSAAVAQATQNAFLQGSLSPSGDAGTQGTVLLSDPLSDSAIEVPQPSATTTFAAAILPNTPTASFNNAAGALNGNYSYLVSYFDVNGNDLASLSAAVNTGGVAGTVQLGNLPTAAQVPTGCGVRIYREDLSAASPTYQLLQQYAPGAAVPATFIDDGSLTPSAQTLSTQNQLTGNYDYYVTYATSPNYFSGSETRPVEVGTPLQLNNGQALLADLPRPTDTNTWRYLRVYRNAPSSGDTTSKYLVGTIDLTAHPAGTLSYIDNQADSSITQKYDPTDDLPATATTVGPQARTLNFDRASISGTTLLSNVLRRDGETFSNVFQPGTFEFTPSKGQRTLSTKSLTITGTTTVADLLKFMNDAMGVQSQLPDSGTSSGGFSGASVVDGQLRFVGNAGLDNAIKIDLSGLQLNTGSGTATVDLNFTAKQDAVGTSAMTDFIAYDSLGNPINVHLTAVLDSRDSTSTTYRWYADSPQNITATSNAGILAGTGLVKFDGLGNFLSATNTNVQVFRQGIAARSPLSFNLDFSQVSGLAAANPSLAVSRQDGSAPGTLTSYIIGEDGLIRGVFSNGVTRDLGQLRLARFANTAGLQQKGQNLYAAGVNSGLPVQGNPGEQGIGSIVAGATELSNTDIGGNLIDLILASTMYRGNSRVITTVQQMFDELLTMQRNG